MESEMRITGSDTSPTNEIKQDDCRSLAKNPVLEPLPVAVHSHSDEPSAGATATSILGCDMLRREADGGEGRGACRVRGGDMASLLAARGATRGRS